MLRRYSAGRDGRYARGMVQILDASANADVDAPVTFVLPGAGYPALAPLLYWPVGMLRADGWRVFTASWDEDDRRHDSAQQMVDTFG